MRGLITCSAEAAQDLERMTTPEGQTGVQVAEEKGQSAPFRLCSIVLHNRLTCTRQKVLKDDYVAPITGQRQLPHDLHSPADGRGTTRPTTMTRGSNHRTPAPENF
ncbi:hypothetical protein HanIR_Chr07g0335851 [Helianthus annuus]|nr:hypothetical protein HanIR_Chr07g0335851 [Helianthus annuus]